MRKVGSLSGLIFTMRSKDCIMGKDTAQNLLNSLIVLGCLKVSPFEYFFNVLKQKFFNVNLRWAADENIKHLAIIHLTHVFKIFSFKFLNITGVIHQIGPGFVILEMKSFFGVVKILLTLTPIRPLEQRLIHYFYGSPLVGLYIKLFFWGETVNVARDAMIWNNKKFVRNPLLVKEDKQIKLFRNWYSQFYSKNSKSFEYACKDDFEW